jgi:glycerol dehydrogenase
VLVQLLLEGKPRLLVEQVLQFATEVGLPITLAEVGLGEMTGDMLNRIATRCTAKGETIHNEPFEVGPEIVCDAIRTADATGRAWKHKHGAP